MIEPKRPEGDSPRARYMQWLHDSIKQMQPITVGGMKMGSTQAGSYRIFEPEELGTPYPLAVRISDNILHYLFDNYEMRDNTFDGILSQPGPITSAVAVAPSPATSGTTLTVTTGDGAHFPDAPFNCQVYAFDIRTAEVVRVTDKGAGDNWTIVRAQSGTTARTIIVGDTVSTADPFQPHYTRNFRYQPSFDHIYIDLKFTGGVWVLKLWHNSDAPFWTGTKENVSTPLGDYTSTDGSPVIPDPITVTKSNPWIVKVDDAFVTWARTSDIAFASIADGQLFWTDPAVPDSVIYLPPATAYADNYHFGKTINSLAHFQILKTIGLDLANPTVVGWAFEITRTADFVNPGWQLIYIPAVGGSSLPYGTYNYSAVSSSGPFPASIPATLTIDPDSTDAPG